MVGLAVAYVSFNRGMTSRRIGGVFRQLLGDRVNGWIGTVVDVLGVVATLFGVAVSRDGCLPGVVAFGGGEGTGDAIGSTAAEDEGLAMWRDTVRGVAADRVVAVSGTGEWPPRSPDSNATGGSARTPTQD